MAGRTALEQRAVHIVDAAADQEYTRAEAVQIGGQRTMLGVPLIREDALIGVITFGRSRVRPFTAKQTALVSTFADQAVIAIENARLLGGLRKRTQDLQESLEYQTATSNVLKVISRSTFDLDPVLDTVVTTAIRLCRADQAVLYRNLNGKYSWAAGASLVPEFQGASFKTIVPTLYGQTERSAAEKPRVPLRQWDESSICADLERRHGSHILRTALKIVKWIKTNTDEPFYGRGSKDGSVGLVVIAHGLRSSPLFLWTYGTVEIAFPYMKKPFDDAAKREELRTRLNKIEGVSLPGDAISKRPGIPLVTFSTDERLESFLEVIDWCVRELRSAPP